MGGKTFMLWTTLGLTMSELEVATLGGGCFWCLDAVFRELRGVEKSVSGYAGGFVANPTYEQVCSGTTGHAEVVEVTFDPRVLSYHDLLEVFFTIHDPTTKDRQGNDEGSQYRSIILHHTPAQKETAQRVQKAMQAHYDAPIVTELEPRREFFAAESYHQDYFRRNPAQGYCRAIISPKVAKFRAKWAPRLR